jgi:hypothetical protein
MIKINCYDTEVKNFFLFVSHGENGSPNISYGLISDDNSKMVEIQPRYGPITILKSENNNMLAEYMKKYKDINRSNWAQIDFDNLNINNDLCNGDFLSIADKLDQYL